MRSKVIADIAIAVMAYAFITECWGKDGWIFTAGLFWGGMCVGYLVTTYLGKGE